MFEVMVVQNMHEDRMRQINQAADERDALKLLQPARRTLTSRIRLAAASLLPHAQQPRRRVTVAS